MYLTLLLSTNKSVLVNNTITTAGDYSSLALLKHRWNAGSQIILLQLFHCLWCVIV